MQDIIERQIAVKATKERVYAAIADPAQVIEWFPDAIEGTFAVGELPVLDFGEDGKNKIYVEAAKPHEYFAFRWVPGANNFMGDVRTVPSTLVEFRIEEADGMTQVTVQESGFASLPAEDAQDRFDMNSGGWEYMIGRLETYLNQA